MCSGGMQWISLHKELGLSKLCMEIMKDMRPHASNYRFLGVISLVMVMQLTYWSVSTNMRSKCMRSLITLSNSLACTTHVFGSCCYFLDRVWHWRLSAVTMLPFIWLYIVCLELVEQTAEVPPTMCRGCRCWCWAWGIICCYFSLSCTLYWYTCI